MPSTDCKTYDRQAYDKNYRQANIKNITAREKAYYETNKDKIKERKALKFDCPCGGQYTYSHKSKHERTKKHLEFIS